MLSLEFTSVVQSIKYKDITPEKEKIKTERLLGINPIVTHRVQRALEGSTDIETQDSEGQS